MQDSFYWQSPVWGKSIACLLYMLLSSTIALAQPTIGTISPGLGAHAVSRSSVVQISFSQPLLTESAAALRVFSSRRGGLLTATTPAVVDGNTLTFRPAANQQYLAGEIITSSVTRVAASSSGYLSQGRVYQFTTAVGGSGQGRFVSGSDLQVGQQPTQVAIGDIDADGDLDLIAANSGGSTVSIRLNDGNGTYPTSNTVTVGASPFSIILGDLDGDGDLDFLTASSANTISVRFNAGNGIFNIGYETVVGYTPLNAIVGDVDADGDLDLLTLGASNGTVSVRTNIGNGTFNQGQEMAVGGGTRSLALSDIDGDGDLDLLTANASNTASVRFNNGEGVFTGTQDVTVGGNARSVAVGDLDGDGDPDLVTAIAGGSISISFNNGSGLFIETQNIPLGLLPVSVVIGDVDADGDLDVVAANNGSNSVSICRNDGTGTFSISSVAVGSGPFQVVLADVDGDDDLDLLTANNTGNSVSVRLNQASPLPVELRTFTAALEKDGNIRLFWRTASEKNNAHFIVERSFDGQLFTRVGILSGHGNSTSLHTYTWRDTTTHKREELRYYRLRQQDIDGTETLSPVRMVMRPASQKSEQFQVYPNPAHQTVWVRLPTESIVPTAVQLFAVRGNLIRTQPCLPEEKELPISLVGLPAGLYILRAGPWHQCILIE